MFFNASCYTTFFFVCFVFQLILCLVSLFIEIIKINILLFIFVFHIINIIKKDMIDKKKKMQFLENNNFLKY
jgi:hypothetical protein